MEFRFVKVDTPEYKQGLLVREELFFKDFPNAQQLLNDAYEQESIHLVAIEDQKVIGTGRLKIQDNKAIISQMTVLPNFQKQQVGKQLVRYLLDKAISLNITTVELNARITALDFYKKYNFTPVGKVFASNKTGVLHQKMILSL